MPTLRLQPLEPPGEVEQPLDLGVVVGQLLQRRLFLERVLERDVEPLGDQLVDLLDPGQRDVHRPADVLDRRLGLERAEGADLRDVGVAVLVPDVVDDLVPALLAEVDVDVGRLGAVGVEEPFEQQVVLERADAAQLEQVAHQGAAGRAAGQRGDAPLAGVADEVPDDQEVRGEPHPVDDAQLVVEALAHLGAGVVAVPVAQALPRRARGGSPRASCSSGGAERGEAALAQAEALVMRLDHRGDPRRGGQGLLVAGHRRVHLLRAADVELLRLEPHPRRVVERLAGADAQQDVVRGGVLAGQVVGVAGRDQRQAHPPGDVDRPFGAIALDRHAVVLDLDVEVLLAEDLLVPGAEPLGLGRLAVEDVVGELRRGAAGEADQPLGVPLEDLLVDPGLVVEALEERQAREPHQVAEAGAVLRQQGQVEGVFLPGDPADAPLGPPPGATYASMPTIGRMPAALASRSSSTAP